MTQLATVLMQLGNLKEQRAARKQQAEFRRAYTAPLMKAQAKYQNALADQANDQTLNDMKEKTEAARARGFNLEADKMKATLDKIAELQKGDEDDQDMARNYLLEIDNSKANADQMRGLTLQNQQMQTAIQAMAHQLSQDRFNLAQLESNLGFLAEYADETEDVMTKSVVDTVRKDLHEKFFGTKIPDKPGPARTKQTGRLGFGVRDKPGGTGRAPVRSPSKAAPKKITQPKQKPAAKAPEASEAMSIDDLRSVSETAKENNISILDVAEGVKALTQTFPEFSKEDQISAAERLAEGFSVEEIKEFYESQKGENE